MKKCCCTCNSSWTSNTAVVVIIAVLALMFFFSISLVKCLGYKQKRKEESGEWCHIAWGLFWGVSCSLALFNSFALEHRERQVSINTASMIWVSSNRLIKTQQYHTVQPELSEQYQVIPDHQEVRLVCERKRLSGLNWTYTLEWTKGDNNNTTSESLPYLSITFGINFCDKINTQNLVMRCISF